MIKLLLRVIIALSLLAIFFFTRPVFAVVLLAALLVNARLVGPMKLPKFFYASLSCGVILYACSFIAYQAIREEEWLWIPALIAIAPSVIGFFSYACLLTIVKDLFYVLTGMRKSVFFQRLAAAIIIPLTVWLGIMSVKNSRDLHVEEVTITLPVKAAGLDGVKIVQLSDLHITRDTPEEWLEEIVEISNAQNADFIVVTGDIIESATPEKLSQLHVLKGLRARYGVYCVLGNHDYFHTDISHILATLEKLGFEPLNNENRLISHHGTTLMLAGVTDPVASKFRAAMPSLIEAVAHSHESVYKILLCHQPVLASSAEKVGFDLQLSGHTHGGQFQPWTFLADKISSYNRGLFELGQMKLYVNEGTGCWIPLRLGTKAEITVISLRNVAASK